MKRLFVIFGVLFLVTVAVLAFDVRLKTVEYTIDSEKLAGEIRLALVCDLHSCYYGDGQKKLLDEIEMYNPDAVLLGGDIFDDKMPDSNAEIFVSAVAKKYRTYYVCGNHELWSGRMPEIFGMLENIGVKPLRGDAERLEVGTAAVNICGIDDADSDESWKEQLAEAGAAALPESFNVLLAHRPENAEEYFGYDFDLVLSGHTHGGQWRLPPFINGVFAPNQGAFPKLAGGVYDFGEKKLIVSRGLARESTRIPRIFNRPELVFVTLK